MGDGTRPDADGPVVGAPSGVELCSLPARVDALMAADGHSETSRSISTTTLTRFVGFAGAAGVEELADVPAEVVAAFVVAPTADGSPPSAATSQSRRSVLRLTYRLLGRDGVPVVDPTWDLPVPSRRAARVRPLVEVELALVREASLLTLVESRLPALVALAEATATASEAARVRFEDLDLDAGTVGLSGSRDSAARTGRFTDWGLVQVRRRVAALDSGDDDRRFVYRGAGRNNAGQASVTGSLHQLLVATGLGSEPGVGVGSIRAWAGRHAWETTGRIEAAAVALGCRSLDTAARVIGWDWHTAS